MNFPPTSAILAIHPILTSAATRGNDWGTATSDDEAANLIEQARFYRGRAKRIRELATAVGHHEATVALRTYADELEQRAIELEAKAASLRHTKPQECD